MVHGGAWKIPDEVVEAHKRGCSAAVDAGYDIVKRGGSALDAVEAAVVVMENDPTYDAGVGSFLNRIGEVELDAAIMEGRLMKAGSVAAVRNIRNPVRLARKVMEASEHVMLVGLGAELFARAAGAPRCRTQDLLVGRELERWRAIRKKKRFLVRRLFEDRSTSREERKRGTVGAVAIDRKGNIAAATSTGGIPNKLPGRVGDSPLIGAGLFADNGTGGVSATGWGEPIIRVVLAKAATDAMGGRLGPAGACRRAVDLLKKRVNGRGGLVGIDRKGRVGFAYNTPRMARALIGPSGRKVVGI